MTRRTRLLPTAVTALLLLAAVAGADRVHAESLPADETVQSQRASYKDLENAAREVGKFLKSLAPPPAGTQGADARARLQLRISGGEDEVSRYSLDDNPYVQASAVAEIGGELKAFKLVPRKDHELPPGRYTVTVTHPRFQPHTVETELKPGKTATLNLSLTPRPADPAANTLAPAPSSPVSTTSPVPPASPVPSIEVRPLGVRDAVAERPLDRPAAIAQGRLKIDVWLEGEDTLLNATATLAAEREGERARIDLTPGRLHDVPAGRYLVTAAARNAASKEVPVQVEPGKTAALEIHLPYRE